MQVKQGYESKGVIITGKNVKIQYIAIITQQLSSIYEKIINKFQNILLPVLQHSYT
jgi:hypothetical protein